MSTLEIKTEIEQIKQKIAQGLGKDETTQLVIALLALQDSLIKELSKE